MQKRLPTKERIALVLLAITLITNPLVGQYILGGLDWAFSQMFRLGGWLNLSASIGLIVYIALEMWDRRDKVVIPKKSTKTQRAGKLIETN